MLNPEPSALCTALPLLRVIEAETLNLDDTAIGCLATNVALGGQGTRRA